MVAATKNQGVSMSAYDHIQLEIESLELDKLYLSEQKDSSSAVKKKAEITAEKSIFIKCTHPKGHLILTKEHFLFEKNIVTDAMKITLNHTTIRSIEAPDAVSFVANDPSELFSVKLPNAKRVALHKTSAIPYFFAENLVALDAHSADIHQIKAPNLKKGNINACPYLMAKEGRICVRGGLVFSPLVAIDKHNTSSVIAFNPNNDLFIHNNNIVEKAVIPNADELLKIIKTYRMPDSYKIAHGFVEQIKLFKDKFCNHTIEQLPQGEFKLKPTLEMV